MTSALTLRNNIFLLILKTNRQWNESTLVSLQAVSLILNTAPLKPGFLACLTSQVRLKDAISTPSVKLLPSAPNPPVSSHHAPLHSPLVVYTSPLSSLLLLLHFSLHPSRLFPPFSLFVILRALPTLLLCYMTRLSALRVLPPSLRRLWWVTWSSSPSLIPPSPYSNDPEPETPEREKDGRINTS